ANTADQPTGQPGNQITVKAAGPGMTSVIATNATTSSLATNFTTCGPVSISLHLQSATDTNISVAVNSSKTLVADAVDKNGTALPPLAVTLTSSNIAASVTGTGSVTGVQPGTAVIVASCSPDACNSGVNAIIVSNPVVVTVTGGTAAATVV